MSIVIIYMHMHTTPLNDRDSDKTDCFFIFSEHLSTKRKCINENPVFQSDLSQNNSIASFLWLHNRTLEHEI